jgi:hypothetical protein
MTIRFTTQDLYTFLIGLGVAVAWELADKLQDSESITSDPFSWGISVVIALAGASGRWILTYLTQKGFQR